MVEIMGCQLNVKVRGEGQGILLLHGWGQNMYMMKFIQDDLCQRFKVVNVDLPGFGKSSEPNFSWGIIDYTNAMKELMDLYNIKKPIIIAHSFGARIALQYALKFPVKAMILTGAAGIRKKHDMKYKVRVKIYKILKRFPFAVSMGSPDYQNASAIMKGVLVKCVNDDISEQLKDIHVPTMLVWGKKDAETPLWMGKQMHKEIPNSKFICIENEGHFAYFTQGIRFLRIVDCFLKGMNE